MVSRSSTSGGFLGEVAGELPSCDTDVGITEGAEVEAFAAEEGAMVIEVELAASVDWDKPKDAE